MKFINRNLLKFVMKYNIHKIFSKNIEELREILNSLLIEDIQNIEKIANLIIDTLRKGNCVFWCGNGGSATDSQHFAAELIGRFQKNRDSYKSLSLSADSAVMTCIANDFGYENLFSRQLEGLGKKDDLLVVLSTSGNSSNIKKVLEVAKKMDIKTISLLGKGGGLVKDFADYTLVVKSDSTARIQEIHALLGHTICEIVEEELGNNKSLI